MRQSIRGYTDGVIERAGPASADIAGDLAAVGDLLASSDDLRNALADPGVPVARRRSVVQDLLSGRVSDDALGLLSFAVDHDRAAEIVDNATWLASRVDAAAHDLQPVGEAVLGHKAAEERVDGYATAVLEGVEGDAALTEVEEGLYRFMRIVGGNDELRAALSSRDVPAASRRQLVVDLLSSRASSTTVNLAAYATQVGRPRDYEDLLRFLVDRVAAESDRRFAEVRSAVDLDEGQRRDLAAAVARVVGRTVQMRVTVDPEVLGGFVATVGDTVVDGSARHRLELLKERLVLPEATITTGDPADG